MSIYTELVLNSLSHLPKIFNWWLYKPEKTIKRIDVNILAKEGSVEIWCDKAQAKFSLWIQFKNNNSFPIEIDRSEASGYLYTAHLKAINLFGKRLKKGESATLHLEGNIDDINLKRVNGSPENESLRLELKAVVLNKYHRIRDFRCQFDRLMCKFYNRKSRRSLDESA